MELRGSVLLLPVANASVCVAGALWRLAGIQLGRLGKAPEGAGEGGRDTEWPWPLSGLGEGRWKWPEPVWDIGKYMLFL